MRVFTSAFVLLLTLGGASAADMQPAYPTKAVSLQQSMNWTGIYGGIFASYHAGKFNQANCVGICPTDPKLNGGVFGLNFGADYQFSNNVVLGIFGILPLTRLNASLPLPPPVPVNFDMKTRYSVMGGARVGYAWGNVLPYALIGVAATGVEAQSQFNGTVNTRTHKGMLLGAGVEYAFARSWSVDLRYIHMDMRKETYDFGGGASQWGERSHNFMLALNYRLN